MKAPRDTTAYLSGRSRRDTDGLGLGLAPDLVMDRLRARVTEGQTVAAAVGAD